MTQTVVLFLPITMDSKDQLGELLFCKAATKTFSLINLYFPDFFYSDGHFCWIVDQKKVDYQNRHHSLINFLSMLNDSFFWHLSIVLESAERQSEAGPLITMCPFT